MPMDLHERQRRGSVVVGLGLIVAGALAIAARAAGVDVLGVGWPLFVIVPGVLLFAAAIAVGARAGVGLAIPGAIVTVAGVILAIQAATGLWATWAYVWALVAPGGVGLGLVLYGIVTGQREFVATGTPTLVVGLGLFLAFALFFEGILGLSGRAIIGLEPLLAIGLVVLGLVLIASGFLRRRDRVS